jgi:parvulin-like peptidyl-prolyl isomerase
MGFFREGELLPELDKIAFSLGVGEVSSLIQTSTGFHIVRVLEKREKQKMPVEDRLKEVENILYDQKVENRYKEWIKGIREKAFIKINL